MRMIIAVLVGIIAMVDTGIILTMFKISSRESRAEEENEFKGNGEQERGMEEGLH